jgi:hypothetical protein
MVQKRITLQLMIDGSATKMIKNHKCFSQKTRLHNFKSWKPKMRIKSTRRRYLRHIARETKLFGVKNNFIRDVKFQRIKLEE